MKLTRAQQSKHDEAVRFRLVDPVTGVRHCRWCLTATRAEGEYLCPQCGRWQHEKAFPDGVPGVSQVRYYCVDNRCPTGKNPDVLTFAHDAENPRCPTCRGDLEEIG